jgi:septum formation protein
MDKNRVKKIILASQSPRRSQLLQWAQIPFEIIVAPVEETYPPGLSPLEIAEFIARNKARASKDLIIRQRKEFIDFPILAADTIVVSGNKIIGKPGNRDEAIKTLQALSGKSHSVITGVCILKGAKEINFSDETTVQFHLLKEEQIEYYVDNYRPYDKAGAYAIQEWIGVIGISSIKGDFYNVMGLPVSLVLKELQALD